MKLAFHRLADRELTDVFHYYEARSEGLGVEFLDEFQRLTRPLLAHPRSAPVVSKIDDIVVRKKILDRFPYGVFFTFDEETLWILAVGHQKRRPDYWISRV